MTISLYDLSGLYYEDFRRMLADVLLRDKAKALDLKIPLRTVLPGRSRSITWRFSEDDIPAWNEMFEQQNKRAMILFTPRTYNTSQEAIFAKVKQKVAEKQVKKNLIAATKFALNGAEIRAEPHNLASLRLAEQNRIINFHTPQSRPQNARPKAPEGKEVKWRENLADYQNGGAVGEYLTFDKRRYRLRTKAGVRGILRGHKFVALSSVRGRYRYCS